KIDISANGSRARLSRDVANVAMDLNGIERIQLNTLGGADTVTVNDLTRTDVTQVGIDLGARPGTAGGDGAADTIVINVTNGNGDDVLIGGAGQDVLDGGPGNNVVIQSASFPASAALLGQFMASSFVPAGVGESGTPVADASASQQQPLLTQPHA